MAKPPDRPRKPKEKPKRDPAKHSKKDPARPTRAKAARPDSPPTEPALAELLNPGIGQGTAGPGSQTGLRPPPDNSFDRRADFSAAHRARKSTTQGFGEAPQAGYVAKATLGPARSIPIWRGRFGIEDDESDAPHPTPLPAKDGEREQTEPGARRSAITTFSWCHRRRGDGACAGDDCCARGGRNSASGRGRRTGRRGRKNPRAGSGW